MPTIGRYGGFRFFFFSEEGLEPPHVHVEHAGRFAKFWLAPVTLAKSRDFSLPELTKLRRIIERRRDEFEEKWHEYFRR